MIPFNNLSRYIEHYRLDIMPILERVLASGHFVLGDEGKSFEREFAAFTKTAYAVGVNSGTDALALALRALEVGAGDEVITVANTAVPTVAAIRMTGATPVFADIDATYTMDPNDLVRRITTKTKAIIPVHLYGFPADMEQISAIANKENISVIEDAAQAHDAMIRGIPVGSFGMCAAFSFYPTKNLGAFGDGGAVVTNNQELAEKVRRLRMYGERTRNDSVEEGVNSRLDEIQAAFLSWGLGHLSMRNERRRDIALRYCANIKNQRIILPSQKQGEREGVWHLFVVQVDDRVAFMRHMEKSEVGTAVHYPIPIYRQPAYSFLSVDPAEFPITERAAPRIVSIPLFPELTDSEVGSVINAINAYGS
ncbi:DegT/DnrJ/EryC1/StrS family aminotransferase [Candidatus Parcubacteria bacterium]|nr:DegT/DnrJ/EryC1/StrS family aminotransferase [Candidatus Parcubacteria bacterium]